MGNEVYQYEPIGQDHIIAEREQGTDDANPKTGIGWADPSND
jgi:hypothetical protein